MTPLDEVKPSQSGSVSQTIADTELTITYNRPVARGRELFGGIIPYGEIWNPGANDATAITLSRAVTINGDRLDAGKYSSGSLRQLPRAGSLLGPDGARADRRRIHLELERSDDRPAV